MKNQRLKLDSSLTQLLTKLSVEAANPCLLNGNGWTERIAWNPCDTYVLEPENKPDENLEKFINRHTAKKHLIAGYLSYNLGYRLHGIAKTAKNRFELPDIVLFAYDNYLEKIDNKVYAHYEKDGFPAEVLKLNKLSPVPSDAKLPKFSRSWDKKDFGAAFKKIQNYIYDGLIYQINLTQELTANYGSDPRQLYTELSRKNTAKMKAYLETDDFELLSMSPERFIRTKDREIETSPIKGTRPRGKNLAEDKANEAGLIKSKKEKAELNMITDLLRNDLGKVCEAGSVKVAAKRQMHRLTSVIHTSSLIKGRLSKDFTPIKALLSMFPGGSITGCPKKKAMEIIDSLEQSARGPYCGCMIVIDEYGNLDSSILIRSIIKKGNNLSLSVGSGIVYDSEMEHEYQETLDKAAPLIGNLS